MRLTRDISPSVAARLCFTADRMDAAAALRLGLVDVVYDTTDALEPAARDLATQIVRNGSAGLTR